MLTFCLIRYVALSVESSYYGRALTATRRRMCGWRETGCGLEDALGVGSKVGQPRPALSAQ